MWIIILYFRTHYVCIVVQTRSPGFAPGFMFLRSFLLMREQPIVRKYHMMIRFYFPWLSWYLFCPLFQQIVRLVLSSINDTACHAGETVAVRVKESFHADR